MRIAIDKIFLFSTMFMFPTIVVAVLLFLFWPRHVIDIHTFEWYEAVGGDRNMKSYTVHAGDTIEYEITFSKYIDAPAETTTLLRQIDNGYVYPYPTPMITRMPVGKDQHYKTDWPIPRATPPGVYIIVRTYRHFINGLQTATTTVTSNKFNVIKPRKDAVALIKEGNEISKQNQLELKGIKGAVKGE